MRDFSKSQKNKINGQELYRGKGGVVFGEKREKFSRKFKKREERSAKKKKIYCKKILIMVEF